MDSQVILKGSKLAKFLPIGRPFDDIGDVTEKTREYAEAILTTMWDSIGSSPEHYFKNKKQNLEKAWK